MLIPDILRRCLTWWNGPKFLLDFIQLPYKTTENTYLSSFLLPEEVQARIKHCERLMDELSRDVNSYSCVIS